MIPPQPPQAGNDLKLDGLTREEIKKIEKSMKRPEFMGLLNEYMVEISDPKNKAEYDEYLKQMEKEGELPKHMKLITLTPEFCIRTFIVSNRNKSHEMKFFINMCSSQYIGKPECETGKDEKGLIGYNWKVPNSLGKIRYDQDKNKNPCQVVDCAFHPDTFKFATHPSFQAMIVGIALEGAERQLGERKETLSKDYVILKNLKCKGENGQPALLPIRWIEGKAYNRGEGPVELERNQEGKETKLQKEIEKQKEEYAKEKEKEKEKKESDAKQEADEDLVEELDDGKKLVEDLEEGIQTPKFTSIYTYKTDYSEFMEGPTLNRKQRSLPHVFTVEFKVPRMEHISEATTLEINENKIVLEVKEKYFIDISFAEMKIKAYPLKTSEAKAKFDKKKGTLRIQIPVDLSSIPEESLENEKVSNENENNQNNQALDEEKVKVIENETWKNKVLELPEDSETTKFIPENETTQKNENEQKEKPLIEEIDEDDEPLSEAIKEKEGKMEEIEEEAENEVNEEKIIRNFTLFDYLDEKPENFGENYAEIEVKELKPIKKTLKNSYVLLCYMRNYRKEQIKYAYTEKNIWLLWKKGGEAFGVNIGVKGKARVEVCERVGFVAFVVRKENEEEIEIEDLGVKNGMNVKSFEKLIDEIDEEKKQKEAERQKELEEASKLVPKPEQQALPTSESQSPTPTPPSESIDSQIPSEPSPSPSATPETVQKPLESMPQNQPFLKLPPQFIRFDVPFIDVLN